MNHKRLNIIEFSSVLCTKKTILLNLKNFILKLYFMEGVNFQSEPTVGLCLNIRFCIMNTIAYELNDGSCCSCLVGQTRNWL